MVDRLLFPTDGSDAAQAGLEYAVALAADTGAELLVLHVADTSEISHTRVDGEVVDAFVDEGESIVEEAVAGTETKDVDVTTDVVQGVPDETIVQYAEQYDIDTIVMPTQGRQGTQHLVGSVTERVLRRAPMPVVALPPEADAAAHFPYAEVLVAIDGSAPSAAAVAAAVETASRHGASLHLVHVVEESLLGGRLPGDVDAEAESLVEAAVETVPSSFAGSVTTSIERALSAEQGLLNYVEANDIDLVVSGSSAGSGLSQHLIGSTTERLIRNASVPVMAVPEES
ncbi:universal stress protein [Natronomonas amylolytica]|uniref:universal stress protein n=1 Tax=Natronomonas amylolytica TaxID=3108498 RepID=UPI00300A13C5